MHTHILSVLNLLARRRHCQHRPFPLAGGLPLSIPPTCSSSSLTHVPSPEEEGSCPKLAEPLSSPTPDEHSRNQCRRPRATSPSCWPPAGTLSSVRHCTGCRGSTVLCRNDGIFRHLFLGFFYTNPSLDKIGRHVTAPQEFGYNCRLRTCSEGSERVQGNHPLAPRMLAFPPSNCVHC